MKRKAYLSHILAALTFIWAMNLYVVPQAATADCDCLECHQIFFPDPETGQVTVIPGCLDLTDDGWRACTEVGSTCWLMYNCSVFTGGCGIGDPYPHVELNAPDEKQAQPSIQLANACPVDAPAAQSEPAADQKPEKDGPRVVYTF